MQNELTKKEQRLMRHWFKKTGENTIELKEKRWAAVKIVLVIILVAGVYYNFTILHTVFTRPVAVFKMKLVLHYLIFTQQRFNNLGVLCF